MLCKDIRLMVFEHIRANARAKDIFLDTIGGYIDHVHALVSLAPGQTIAKVAQLLKGESSHWVNKESLTRTQFEWQDEYAAFSVSEPRVETVRRYIKGQEEHHRKKAFAEEYREVMAQHGFTIEGLKSR
jgi:REP element-mobilizing transposase RayT